MAMNPIERALARADKITAANNELEAMSRPKITLGQHLAGMKGGETREFGVQGSADRFHVAYRDRPSYGDNGFQVPGATTGEYRIIRQPGDMTAPKLDSTHEHGPHANTEAARQRGASRNAKPLAADAAARRLTQLGGVAQSQAAGGAASIFNDKRQ